MHRTQITLEDTQYLTLREQARRTGKSMGQLIREMLDRELGAQATSCRKGASGLKKLRGILNDPGFCGEDHDETLFGGTLMERLFVDTSAWYAYANAQDPRHDDVVKALTPWEGRLLTTFAVMERLGLKTAAALDVDFRRAGFTTVP